MLIYNYDKFTKEFLGSSIAESDPEETRKKCEFVPLVPDNATLTKNPNYDETKQIPVYEGGWIVKDDFRKNYYKVDNNLNVNNITTIGKQDDYIIVTKEVGEDIKLNKDWYKIVDNEIIKKSEEEYEKEQEEKEKERIGNLTCTKRVFILMLEELGYDYFEQIQPLIEANRQAKLEWELCSELQRKNELIDTIAAKLEITSEQLDKLFKYANGEIGLEEFKK